MLKTRREFMQQSIAASLLSRGAIGRGLTSGKETIGKNIELMPLDDKKYWIFQKFLGDGEMQVMQNGKGVVVEISSSGGEGMAAILRSPKIPIEPGRKYKVTMEIKTAGLEATTAELTGAPYVLFWDANLLPGSIQPTPGTTAPRDSDWHEVVAEFVAPTTARKAEVRLAFAAYSRNYVSGVSLYDAGLAKGKLSIRNVRIETGETVRPLPSTIHVSDPTIQAGMDTVAECLHNAQLSGMFTVGDGYTTSGNIVPDLSFGLFGVRRMAYPAYLNLFKKYWESIGARVSDEGKTPQRVMAQIFFPLGIDEIFSYGGDMNFLAKQMPIVDRSFSYLGKRADRNSLIRLVEYGKWQIGEGADWVDWYPTRMEGKTFNFHQWYVRALRRFAALHEEFAGKTSFASADLAQEYRIRAEQIERSLRRLYWFEDHFVTNIDYGGRIADEKWLDDHVWAIKFGIATPEQTRKIWSWIDAAPFKYEGTPTRWASFDGPTHGPMTWFGRLGCGDILARYRDGNSERGLKLLERISEVFARDRNVYESYDMYGDIDPGTKGWGNYTEHCGGYVWAMAEGPFGVNFDSDGQAVAIIEPRFPKEWTSASAEFYVRGTRLQMSFARSEGVGHLSLAAHGDPQPVRIRLPNGRAEIVRAQTGFTQSWPC